MTSARTDRDFRAIHFDESLYKEAQRFEPARYLSRPLSAADYINSTDPLARDHFTYGAGRRVCPGVHVAERSLYINIVRTLWGFNITKTKDARGDDVEPETAMVRGFLSVPEKFAADLRVRSDRHREVIEMALAEVSGGKP